jgi:PAS domain S-box-containing protein
MKIISKMKIRYSLIGLIVMPIFGWLALTGTGHAGDLYRYLVPALVGCTAGFLIGRERGRYINKQRELAESQDFLQSIIDNIPAPIYLKDFDGKYLFINKQYEFLTDTPRKNITGKNDFDIFPKQIATLFRSQDDQVRDGNVPMEFEETIPLKDGVYTFITSKFPLTDKNGEIYAVGGFCTDISETIHSQEALERREAKLKTILQTAPTGIGVIVDRVFQEVNQRFCDMVGYSEDELLGKNSRMVYSSDEEHERVGQEEMELIRKHGLGNVESCLRHENGKTINILVSWSPLNKDDLSAGIIFNALDITEIKKLEGQLFQSQKMESIGRLAGGIAHDFNNILTTINGYAQMVLMRLEDGSKLKQDVEKIIKSGNRAANLTRQLLGFSRKQMIMPKHVYINKLITDMEEMLRRIISEDITLKTSLDEYVDTIYADPGQLDQVLMNLVINSRDAVKSKSETAERIIKISTSQVFLDQDYATVHPDTTPGWYMELQVEDSGCGMTEEVQKNIFEPFYTTKDIGKGTGMGLATVYGIIKQNDGSIYVYSEPGQGSTFKVYWPIMTTEGTKVVDEMSELSSGGSEVILLTEDDQQIREITSRQLREAGYTVIEAENGLDALEKAKKHQGGIDMLFTDAVMPIMGGKELSKKIKDIYPNIPVLFASGYTDNGIHQNITNLDGNRFINKPYNIQQIMASIRRLLDKK